jgi:hypothetical protein
MVPGWSDERLVLHAYDLQDAWLGLPDEERTADRLRRVRRAEALAHDAMARLTARLGADGARDAISAAMRDRRVEA